MTVLAFFEALPFSFLVVGFFLQHFTPLFPFPSLADFLGTGDFLAHPLLGKGGGVHIFTRAAALTLFKSSETPLSLAISHSTGL